MCCQREHKPDSLAACKKERLFAEPLITPVVYEEKAAKKKTEKDTVTPDADDTGEA